MKSFHTTFDCYVHYGQTDLKSCACFARRTLPEALTEAFKTASYYLGGYPLVEIEIVEHCSQCAGGGSFTVKRPRSYRTVKCQQCNGHKGPVQTILFKVETHENVTVANPAYATA